MISVDKGKVRIKGTETDVLVEYQLLTSEIFKLISINDRDIATMMMLNLAISALYIDKETGIKTEDAEFIAGAVELIKKTMDKRFVKESKDGKDEN